MIPTHNNLRCLDTVFAMESCWEELKPINVIVTEDGQEWIRDGHHRACALWLVHGYVPEKFVVYERHSYQSLNEINIPVGWVVPFDPRTHCRFDNFLSYRQTVDYLYKTHGLQHATRYVELFNHIFKEKRIVHSIKDLFERAKCSRKH